MGRLNKKLQKASAKSTPTRNQGISKSAVLQTLARQDSNQKHKTQEVANKKTVLSKKSQLPKTLDELDTDSDFQLLLLDKQSALEKLAQESGLCQINLDGSDKNKIKKKDKMKMRKELLHKKIHVMKLLKEEEKATKKRKQTVVTGDMKPIIDTLDQVLTEEVQPREKQKQDQVQRIKKPKGTLKQKRVKASLMAGVSMFSQVTSHPRYVKDPFGTISTHIENKMLAEAMNAE